MQIFEPSTGEMISEPIPAERMVELYAVAMKQAERFRAMAGKLERNMIQYMEVQGATAIPHETYDVGITQSMTYDRTRFTPLLEMFNESDLEKCYTREQTVTEPVTTPASWNTQQVKAAAKRYGSKALAIVDDAAIPGPRKVNLKERAKKD